jgi:membrane AbrB-like protein
LRYGASPTPVIFSQSLRIMLIIMILPPLIVWVGGDSSVVAAAFQDDNWSVVGAVFLLAIAVAAALLSLRLKLPNPYFMGPLIAAITCRLVDAPVTAFPNWGLTLAQMLLGIWLGASLDLNFLRTSKHILLGIVVSILVLLAMSVALGFGLAMWMGIPWQVALLATAPGGVAEMALTAKILQQGVALVISFHLTRIFILQLASPVIVRQLSKRLVAHV